MLTPKTALALENAALRQQLAAYQRSAKQPRLQASDRVFWAVLRIVWSDWPRALFIVKPATVIGWCNKGLKVLWRHKCKTG